VAAKVIALMSSWQGWKGKALNRFGAAAADNAGVLILGGSYGSLAVARSLGRRGIAVAFLGDVHSIAAASRYVQHLGVWKGVREPDPLAVVLDFAQMHKLDGWVILPAADFEVQLVAEARDALAARFFPLGMDWQALSVLNEKARLYALAESLGLDYPRVYPCNASPAALTYPVVVKPSSTHALNALTKAKAWQANDAAQFARMQSEASALMGPEGFVVQQRIPGDGLTQLSYAGLWDRGQEICGMTARRLRQFPLDFGTSPYVQSIDLPDVAEEARRLLEAVGYTGLVEVEFKRDPRDGRLKLLDVNTRIWAWIGLGDAVGLDFAGMAFALARGMAMPKAARPQYGPAWRRAVPNMLSSVQDLMRNGRPGLAPVRAILGPAQSAIFAMDDLRPALADLPIQVRRRLSERAARAS